MLRSLLRPAKRTLVQLLRDSRVPSTVAGPPKGYHAHTADWVGSYRGEHASALPAYRELLPAETVRRELPGTLETDVHWKFRALLGQVHSPCFVASIPGGRVWGKNGTVVTPDDQLLGDVSRESNLPARHHSAFRCLRLGRVRKLGGRVAVCASVWSNVYFHWMFDILPRIGLLKMAGVLDTVDKFVVPPTPLPFQRESLARLGVPQDRLIVADDPWHFHISAEELLVPSMPSALDTPRAWGCAFLKGNLGETADPCKRDRRRLYISRAKAAGRRIVNEAEVQKVLRARGFETVELEGMALSEQARMFGSAEIIVAPHGAGLTNIVFCRKGTVIIDLFAPTYVNPCYWVVSEACGLRYFYLIGEGARPPDGVDPDCKSDDITVDSSALRRLIDESGCE